MRIGLAESDDKLNAILKTIGVNECCTLVFTVLFYIFIKTSLLILIILLFYIHKNSLEQKVHQKQSWLVMITSHIMHL